MYVIYDKESTIILANSRTRKRSYSTMRAAKAALTRAESDAHNKNKPFVRDDYAIADAVVFRETIEKTVTVTNLISGIEFQESVNTPSYLSPACESYYTM